MSTNRDEYAPALFGCSMAGGIFVPFNAAWRGDLLEYALRDSNPRVVLVGTDQWDQFSAALAATGSACTAVTLGGSREGAIPYEEFLCRGAIAVIQPQYPWDLAMINYTSGTTGPSKGIMFSHNMILSSFSGTCADLLGIGRGDVFFTGLPLFHGLALFIGIVGALQRGGQGVIGPRFSLTSFWEEVRDSGATTTAMLGSMVPLLWNASSSPAEKEHRVHTALVVPSPYEYYKEFVRRFNLQMVECYGLLDVGTLIGHAPGKGRLGSCGRPLLDWEIALVDDHDRPVPTGQVGELVARPKVPFITSLGYWNKPEATVAAWRNLWAHSGDYLRCDEDGWYYFVDRKKDYIRRGGENISSYEVEQTIMRHPEVEEVAVYAVRSELAEDEVMAAVILRAGANVTAGRLHEFCLERLAYFAVPRYIRVVGNMPKTHTERVQKAILRSEGVTVDVWDAGPRARRR